MYLYHMINTRNQRTSGILLSHELKYMRGLREEQMLPRTAPVIAQGQQQGSAKVGWAGFQSHKLLVMEGQGCMASSQGGLQSEKGFLFE